ncbi:hypothetical protein [Teichococcus oryzae]|uniref:Uncharacterized protein n=1 Tax=Teichococcus oryzae TaxID=1608942 RepID=A0A5B2TEV1_9PROT|nr:hypothetical protein [Pseudoroseomonas oryzae]KAA2212555.1 hypothetical protein F0Q34_14630 [Pseudoroseomonas oryzae]
MTAPNAPDQEAVDQAEALAREMAPELRSVVLTHYPDADTLDLMRPAGPSLDTMRAVNRAVAAEMLRQGVEVMVQVADRAAFRRWMDGRSDTEGSRLGWRDQNPVLRGTEALRALGISAPPPDARRPDKAAGTPADRLVRLFAGEDGAAFDACAEALIAAGRDGVLEQAVRRAEERHGEEAGQDLAHELLAIAGVANAGPSGWVELVALPVALPLGPLPDAAALCASLQAAGTFRKGLELHLLPHWRSPDTLGELTPGQVRQALLDLVANRQPASLPPAEEAALAEGGFGVLVGIQLDWTVPLWDEIAVTGLPDLPDEDEPTPEEAAEAEAFDRWRGAAFQDFNGCVPLALVPFSGVDAEIASFLEEAADQTNGLQEIRDFIDMARREAPGEELVCVPRVEGESLHLALYTRSGRLMDQISLDAEQLPMAAAEMPALLESLIPVMPRPPA